MRLYLFPITRNRTLLYCKRSNIAASLTAKPASDSANAGAPASATPVQQQQQQQAQQPKPSLIERVQAKANSTWVKWESEPRGWKRTVTGWGNQAFARIPYQEWGLKSIPPLRAVRRADEKAQPGSAERKGDVVDVVFPERLLDASRALSVLGQLSSDAQRREYRRRMLWSVLAMPFTIPFILVPIVPNLPFFYLVFRAWSHWRAQAGCAHVQHLLTNNLLNPTPSKLLQTVYDAAPLDESKVAALQKEVDAHKKDVEEKGPRTDHPDQAIEDATMRILADAQGSSAGNLSQRAGEEALLFPKGHGKALSLAINLPEVEAELERAHAQVEKALAKEGETSEKPADSQGVDK